MNRLSIWRSASVLLLATMISSAMEQGCPVQDAEVEDPLEALIEKTNELEAFVATYRLIGPDGEIALRLAYSAPGRATLSSEHGHGVTTYMGALDGILHYRVRDADGEERGYQADMKKLEALTDRVEAEFTAEFPPLEKDSQETRGLGAGAFFRMRFEAGDDGKVSGDYSVGYGAHREIVCSWLKWLQEARRLPTEAPELLRYETDDGLLAELSAENGFLRRVWRKDVEPERRSMVLESLDLAPEFAADEFDAPGELEPPPEDPTLMERQLRDQMLWKVREVQYEYLEIVLESGALEWNEETRSRCARTFRSCAELAHTPDLERYRDSLEKSFSELGGPLVERAGQILDEENAAEQIRRIGDSLLTEAEETLGLTRQKFAGVSLPPTVSKSSSPLREVLHVEEETLKLLFDERVGDPARAHLQKLIDDILEGLQTAR